MPMHDWTRVPAGIFHAFHHDWITDLGRTLNGGLLPNDYYALPEQQAAGFGPDVLTLQAPAANQGDGANQGDEAEASAGGAVTMIATRPQTHFVAETDAEFYRRRKSSIVVRHVSGDRIAAVLEVVSPGNKASRHAFNAFVEKACELLERRVHLLLVDPLPPGRRDPNGIHAAIWEEIQDEPFLLPADKPLTLVAYECDLTTRAYIETIGAGDRLPAMPLFLEPGAHVLVPLDATYQMAFDALPRRWQRVLE